MFFVPLETATVARGIHNEGNSYLDTVESWRETHIVPSAADGVPAVMGKIGECRTLMKDENPEILIMHWVIHREICKLKI